MNTYTKLRDGWGVRATQPAKVGETITVQTKAGATKTETVARVIWQGPDKKTGQTIYLLAINPTQAGNGNGYAPGKRCFCAECGEPYRKGNRCWETGGHCVPEWE